MKIEIVKIMVSVMMLLTVVIPVVAQPGAPPATPIDGGLSLLLAAGGAYGIKKIRDSRR
tara:strand:- start:216 stop:392 length:177 start_codon:yes stop_codon:yes gene_type:complete